MYINHEHWGNVDKLWKGIGYGLTKLLLPYGRIYNGKSMEDPCIGPRTSAADPLEQSDNKANPTRLRLVYCTEGIDGAITRSFDDIYVEDTSATPDVYKTFDNIATEVTNSLKGKYNFSVKTWLSEAIISLGGSHDPNKDINALPIYIQNLDDAEINLYVHSLVKFQNVTPSDGSSADKHSIDANPLVGRVSQSRSLVVCALP